MNKTSSGALILDTLLNGGYDNDVVTTVYGPSGSGKTNLCLLAAVHVAKAGKKVIFIDTEGGIAVERIKQISNGSTEVFDNFIFFRPLTFVDQKEVFAKLKECITPDVGLIVADSISMLYRLELGKSDEVFEVNSALGRQIATLVEISRKHKIPVLLTNQVYADFNNRNEVKMVGGDLLKYGSKCLIELKRSGPRRELMLKKHRSLPEGLTAAFKIVDTGVVGYTE